MKISSSFMIYSTFILVTIFQYFSSLAQSDLVVFQGPGGKYGIKNKSGKIIVQPVYEEAGDSYFEGFFDGVISVKQNGMWGYIDSTGKIIVPIKYQSVDIGFSEGFAAVKQGNKWGFVDKKGKEVIPVKYESTGMGGFKNSFAIVRLNGKYGFIDSKGNEVNIKYDAVKDFSDGLAMVNLNKKWGFIDKNGKEVVPLKYDKVKYFYENLSAVQLNNKWGFIDKSGNEIIPFEYDDIVLEFSKGKASVRKSGVVSVIFNPLKGN